MPCHLTSQSRLILEDLQPFSLTLFSVIKHQTSTVTILNLEEIAGRSRHNCYAVRSLYRVHCCLFSLALTVRASL
jgi:hypothetical protein